LHLDATTIAKQHVLLAPIEAFSKASRLQYAPPKSKLLDMLPPSPRGLVGLHTHHHSLLGRGGDIVGISSVQNPWLEKGILIEIGF
jgi:hypothetical protein